MPCCQNSCGDLYHVFDDGVHDPHDPGAVLHDDQALLQGHQINAPELREDILRVRVRFEHSDECLRTSLQVDN